jgi:hypothetical protein
MTLGDAWRQHRRLLTVVALVALGALCLSFVGGWLVGSRTASAPSAEPTVIRVPALDPAVGAVTMPDVRGLDEQTAMQVLADAGITLDRVSLTTKAYAGASGVVVEQTPAFGADAPDEVSIAISTPAVVPPSIGRPVGEVVDDLAELGAAVTRVGVYDPVAKVGTVLAVDPVAGESLPETVMVTVAVAPSSTFLTQVVTAAGGCSTVDETVGGTPFDDALACRSSSSGRTTTWLLAGAVDTLTGELGIADEADTATHVTVQLVVDGRLAASYEVRWGQRQHVELSTTGALKLSIVVTGDGTEAVFGDALLAGDPIGMSKLETR